MALKISAELAHHCPPEDIPRHADALESGGFHRVWVPDTFVSPWEAWTAAGVVIRRTRRIRVGLGVTNPYTRHPTSTAQTAATLQHLGGDRLALSIGRGVPRFLEKAGIPQHPAAVEECIHVLRGLLAGGRFTFEGDVFRIDGLKLRTPPLGRPIPLYAAAIGPAGWEAAVRAADGVATFWHPGAGKTAAAALSGRSLPVAALIPFTLSQGRFPEGWKAVRSPEELRAQVNAMEREGMDEAILAYRDLPDLEAAASLIGPFR